MNFRFSLSSGMGRPCCDGGEPAREQVDSRKVRLPGELQCGVDAGRAEDGGFGAAVAKVGFCFFPNLTVEKGIAVIDRFDVSVCLSCRQVIIVLTQLEGFGGFSIAHRLTHRLANSSGLHDWGPPDATHCPSIENVNGLHAPRLIT